jgi:hypothetical protein
MVPAAHPVQGQQLHRAIQEVIMTQQPVQALVQELAELAQAALVELEVWALVLAGCLEQVQELAELDLELMEPG